MESPFSAPSTRTPHDEVSLFDVATVLFRWRWWIIALGVGGGLSGLMMGLTSTRMYRSSATIVPQISDAATSGLAAAAGQFGIRVSTPANGSTWGPSMYVKLVETRALLEPIALDTLVVPEEGGRRVAVLDLLKPEGSTRAERIARGVQTLSGIVSANEDRRLGTVEIMVTSKWPSVSLALAERVVERLNDFNLKTRQSQAASERRFVEQQAAEAEQRLREAEAELLRFLERNRVTFAPELAAQRDRLERDVIMRQSLYSSWLQNREEARIREVRDTPVITVVEPPRYPHEGLARRSVRKGILGGLAGGMLAVLLALTVNAAQRARRSPSQHAREFFDTVRQARPRFLSRRGA